MTPTQDELRELADRLLTGGSNYLSLRNRLCAIADVWKSSEQARLRAEDDSNRVIGNLEKALGIEYGLRQRAEKAIRRLIKETPFVPDKNGISLRISFEQMRELASLAPDAPVEGNSPACNSYEGMTEAEKAWWMRMNVGDIAAELSATFDLGLPVCAEIAKWILAPDAPKEEP